VRRSGARSRIRIEPKARHTHMYLYMECFLSIFEYIDSVLSVYTPHAHRTYTVPGKPEKRDRWTRPRGGRRPPPREHICSTRAQITTCGDPHLGGTSRVGVGVGVCGWAALRPSLYRHTYRIHCTYTPYRHIYIEYDPRRVASIGVCIEYIIRSI